MACLIASVKAVSNCADELAYKASSGFLDKDDVFHEDIQVLVHRECHNDYVYSPFNEIEKSLKEGI